MIETAIIVFYINTTEKSKTVVSRKIAKPQNKLKESMIKHFRLYLLVAFCLYFSVSIATPPTLAPYHQYNVSGKIERISNSSKANFVVSLVGKFSDINKDSIINITKVNTTEKNENEKYLTDSTGNFIIIVSSTIKADSLAVKVSAPDKQDVIGFFFTVGAPSFTVQSEYVEDRMGCECEYSTDAKKYAETKYYRYDFQNKTVTIP